MTAAVTPESLGAAPLFSARLNTTDVSELIGKYLYKLDVPIECSRLTRCPGGILGDLLADELAQLHDVHSKSEKASDPNRARHLHFVLEWGVQFGISAAMHALTSAPKDASLLRLFCALKDEAADRVRTSHDFFVEEQKDRKSPHGNGSGQRSRRKREA
ncbi:MAG: hypothetical protein WBW89_00075 [Candidatus Cybelea sp.]